MDKFKSKYREKAIKQFESLHGCSHELANELDLEIKDHCDMESHVKGRDAKKLYISKARHLFVNMKDSSESYVINDKPLLDDLNEGKITVKQLVKMEPREINPEKFKKYAIKDDEYAETITKGNAVAKTNMYRCEKCKRNECTSNGGKQKRSADEGTTVDIKCMYCGNSWSIQN